MNTKIFFTLFYLLLVSHINWAFIELFPYESYKKCNASEIYNAEIMKCEYCNPKKNLIPNIDKQECICDGISKPIYDKNSLSTVKCEKCPPKHIYSNEIKSCIKCENRTTNKLNEMCHLCKPNEIMIHRTMNGTYLNEIRCVECVNGVKPSEDKKVCLPCPIVNPITVNNTVKCACDYKSVLVGNMCFPSSSASEIINKVGKYYFQYDSERKIESELFDKYLRQSIFLCKMKNSMACQLLANLCTLTLYSNYENSPCNLWLESRYSVKSENVNYLPWLLYREGDAAVVLARRDIGARYSLNPSEKTSRLQFRAIVYNLNGTFKSTIDLAGSRLIMCPESNEIKNEALRFGVNFQYSCNVDAQQLLDGRETEFIVPYLQYESGNATMMYAVPTLIRNLPQHNNKDNNEHNWLLVRRFHFVDRVSTVRAVSNVPQLVRYIKNIRIRVRLRDDDTAAIYPPLLLIEYDDITYEEYVNHKKVKFHFSVTYDVSNDMAYGIEVSVGVLSAFAVLYTGIQTWSYSRRRGKLTIDFMTFFHLCLFSCGNLANVLYIVAACFSVHAFIFYKGQSVPHILLPTSSNETIVVNYIIAAFSLKLVEVCSLLWHQANVDIFLVDWERPRPNDSVPRSINTISTKSADSPISVWRTFFVANEWNEIQTKRKINLWLHVIITIFILNILGLENWATVDPELHTVAPEHLKKTPSNFVCRLAVGVLVYVSVYLVQLTFVIGIYKRYVKNYIQEFVDVCSLSNISVFIMCLERYGFYIHGRSSHGFADTDMQTMVNQLRREEENLCGHRGLIPGTTQQTFSISVPSKLRLYYNKLMLPMTSYSVTRISEINFLKNVHRKLDNLDKIVQSYHNINRFLTAFLEHALKDVDYDVKVKMCAETLLDIEFTDSFERGTFYADSGHSFDRVLFYGNEFTLFSFDIILFSFVLIFCNNFILSLLITVFCAEIIRMIRSIAGKKNLAKKTLIDERFLI